jgi:hypothetical protein
MSTELVKGILKLPNLKKDSSISINNTSRPSIFASENSLLKSKQSSTLELDIPVDISKMMND